MALYDLNVVLGLAEEEARARAAAEMGVYPDQLGASSIAAIWGVSVDEAAAMVVEAIDRELEDLRAAIDG